MMKRSFTARISADRRLTTLEQREFIIILVSSDRNCTKGRHIKIL